MYASDTQGGHNNMKSAVSLRQLGLSPVPSLPGGPVFWPLCPSSRRNPRRDATCPVFSVIPCWVHVIQPGIEMWATICKTVRPMLSDRCLSAPSVLSCLSVLSVTLVYCGQTVGWINMKLGKQVVLGPGHIVLDGNPAFLPQRGTAPNLWPIYLVAKWLDGLRYHLGGR